MSQCDDLGEVNLLDEVGSLTVAGLGGGNFIKCHKRGWKEKKSWRNKSFKKGWNVGKGGGALKERVCDSLYKL